VKTYMAKQDAVPAGWHVMDAEGVPLGRLAASAARVLMGKHRPEYTPHVDTGEYVVVVNAGKVRLTGKKRFTKVYRYHLGYLGHLRETPAADLLASRPEKVVELAVQRMLPKTKLGRRMIRKLKIYPGPEHPHGAQQPRPWKGGFGRSMPGSEGED